MPTLEIPEEAYEAISKKLAAVMTLSYQANSEKASLLLVWRKEGKKKKKTDKARSGASTNCKTGKKRIQGASSLPPATAPPGPDSVKKTQWKSSSMRRRNNRRRAAWIAEMKISVGEKTEEAAPESVPPVADLEVDEMDAAPPESTPPDSDTETEEEMEIAAPRCPSPVPDSPPRLAVGTTVYKKIAQQPATKYVPTGNTFWARRLSPPTQEEPTAKPAKSLVNTVWARRLPPPTQEELREYGLQDWLG
jgi:hypothetical protein